MKKVYKVFIISIISYFVFLLVISIYDINQILNNTVPFDYKKKLDKNKSEYTLNIDIECNKYYDREIGIIFKPKYITTHETIFKIDFEIKQDGKILKKGSSSNNTIYGKGKRVLILKYKPLDSFFCNRQNININIKKANQNIDFIKNELFFYVSKPRSL